MSLSLYVSFEGASVGRLTSDADGVFVFAYDDRWLASKKAFALSLVLPLREEAFRGRGVAAFFDNLLPEGDARRRIERLASIPEGNDLAFLAHYGQDCAGAFVISPEKNPERSSPALHAEIEVTPDALAKVIDAGAALHAAIGLPEEELPRFSLAGAQAKFACVLRDGKIFLPRVGEPSTHIVKLPIPSGKKVLDSVQNEFLCMKLAALVGVDAPAVDVSPGKHPVLVVERFDREEHGGAIRRRHAMDLCQALGVPSKEKYEVHGGPGAGACFALIKGHVINVATALLAYTDWIAFNLAIGNNDTHAKNVSLLRNRDGDLELAPFYDLVATALYPQFNTRFAFKLGSTDVWAKLRKEDLGALARTFGVTEGFLRNRWLAVFERIEGVLPTLKKLDAAVDVKKPFGKLMAEVDKRISHLRAYL